MKKVNNQVPALFVLKQLSLTIFKTLYIISQILRNERLIILKWNTITGK